MFRQRVIRMIGFLTPLTVLDKMLNIPTLLIICTVLQGIPVYSTSCNSIRSNVIEALSPSSIIASSEHESADNIKMNSTSGWVPMSGDDPAYVQITLPSIYRIDSYEIAAQNATGNYVSKFNMSYSLDGILWMNYTMSSGNIKTFVGSSSTGVNIVNMARPIYAKYLQILPHTCPGTSCGMRLEIVGCPCSPAYLTTEDITGFIVWNLNENFVYLEKGSSTTVLFKYTSGNNLGMVAALDTDTLLGYVNENDKTVSVFVSSERFPGLGTYLLTTGITTCMINSAFKDLVVYHEESITDITVINPFGGNFVPIGENVDLMITMTTGSNIQVEWMMDHNITTCLEEYPDIVRNVSKTFTFPRYDAYNITAFARNGLGSVYKIVALQAIRRVVNFTVNTTPGLYNTREIFNITVSNDLDYSYLQEMGDVYLDVVYGYGSNDTHLLNPFFNNDTGLTKTFSCQYLVQGNYSLIAVIRNGVNSQEFAFEFYAWDEINVSLSSPYLAEIGLPTAFEFLNPPLSGFMYRIVYGDGVTFETNETIWYADYNVAKWDYFYTDPNTYVVFMTAWNPFYIVVQSYSIIAQHPIPEMTLHPIDGDFPFPSGRAPFTLTMNDNKPSPTDINCTFDFDEYAEQTYGTILEYSTPLEKEYTYSTTGTKQISFHCQNLVSYTMKNATVNVITFDVADFIIDHEPVVGMNMTLVDTNDTETNPFGISAVPVDVTFTTALYRMNIMPPAITFEWSFDDDGPTVKVVNPDFSYTHTYTERGYHEGILIITYGSSDPVVIPFGIVLGIVNFTSDIYKGSPGRDTFTFSAVGLEGTGLYAFDLDITSVTKTSAGLTAVTQSLLYPSRGRYLPSLLATNGSLTEFLYTPQHIGVDYVFEGINMTVPDTVALPTGETNFIFGVPEGADPVFDITCSFISGDKIDRALHSHTQNISDGNPIVYNYTYLTLGNHEFLLTCENYAHKVSNNTIISVQNECYSINGIFDRQYSNKTTPMIVLTSKDIDLASRMLVYCPERGPQYIWHFYEIKDETEIPFHYNPVFKPTGTVRFAKGTVQEGLYKVSLNVSLDDTWIQEYTFVRFKKPKPYAYIVRGSKLITSMISLTLQMDAFTESYDAQLGHGYNTELSFTWYCINLQTSSILDLDNYFTTNFGDYDVLSPSNCSGLLEDDDMNGIATLNITSPDYNGYIVIVRVTKDDLYSYFAQLIQTVTGDPHDVSIICAINCQEKQAVTSILSVSAICNDCTATDVLSYLWTLRKYENGSYIEITNLTDLTLTGIDDFNLVLRENVLELGTKYTLSVEVTTPVRDPAVAMMDIFADFPPYNGTCYTTPKIGYGSETKFSVICSDWLDEGIFFQRSNLRDPTLTEPLVYQYTSFITKINTDGSTETTQVPLFRGSESTATELTLSVGSKSNNYYVDIEVRIFDRYGDFTIFSSHETRVKVIPNPEMVPTDPNDVNATAALFAVFDRTYNITKAGGNSMAVVRLVGSTASVYLSADLQYVSNTTSANDLLAGSTDPSTISTTVTLFPVQKELISRTTQFTKILLDSTVMVSTSGDESPISTAHVRQVARSLETCTSVPSYVDEQSLDNAAEGSKVLMKNIRKVTESNPFPIEDTTNIQDSADGVVSVLSNIIGIAVPNAVYDPDDSFTLADVDAELNDYEFYGDQYTHLSDMNTEERERFAEALYAVKRTEREQQDQQRATAQSVVPKMISAIKDTLLAKSKIAQVGAGIDSVQKTNIDVSVEKERPDLLINKTIPRLDVNIELDPDSLSSSSSDSMELRVAAFEKDPYFYASGASLVTSTVISVDTYDNNKNGVNMQKDVKFKNKGSAYFKTYHPTNISDGIDPMFYFVSELRGSDAVLVYLNPEDYTAGGDMEDLTFYSVFVKTGDYPTSSDYTYATQVKALNWEDPYGLKVFIPDKILGKGRLYIGLKPTNVPTQPSPTSKRKRRCATSCAATFNPPDSNFSITIATAGCRSFDENTNAWVDTGCKTQGVCDQSTGNVHFPMTHDPTSGFPEVLELSTLNETICRCFDSPGNTFASTFYVPPNKIDFNSVWSKFDASNAAVYGTVIGLIILYIVLVILLRRQDKKDIYRWATRFLCDTESTDTYFYLLNVQTGMRGESGTESNVNFILSGEERDSGVRILADGFESGFPSSSVRTFIMGTKAPLGDLTYLRIWHDNSGAGDLKSWYLHKFMVDDLQGSKRYIFLCDRWLAIEQDDGMVERILPVCSMNKLTNYEELISQQARFNVTENHLWLSMLIRPQRSSFSRVQRLSCAFALLFLTMIASAMFFRTSDEVGPEQVSIGFLRFSLTNIYISFVSVLIATVPIFLVTFIFKKTKSKPKKETSMKSKELESALDKTIKEANVDSIETSHIGDNGAVEFIKEENKPFPHFVVYIGWIILFLAVVTSAFFLILYSMEWGKSKSEEWLSTFFFSFAESLFLLDPLNVILMSVVVAVLFRKAVDGDCPAVNLDNIKSAASAHREDSSRQYTTFRMQILAKTAPPTETALEDVRKLRKSEVEAQAVFRRLVIYSIYVFVIFSISYINRDSRSYQLKKNIESQIYETSGPTFGFENINTTEGYYLWLNKTFFPKYFPTLDFSGNALGVLDKLYFADMANARVGPARLRQLRQSMTTCNYVINDNYPCVEEYHADMEDTNDYCIGWQVYNSSCAQNAGSYFTSDAWKYKSPDDTWGMSFIGKHKVYQGGGYVLTFDLDLVNSRSMLNELYQNNWIDRKTRGVLLEFTLYNPNINLFLYSVFLTEFIETGGCLIWIDIQAFRPYQTLGAVGTFALLCYFIYLIFLIIASVRTVLRVRKEGRVFFKSPWNLVDLLCSLLGIVAIALWALRLKFANEALDRYYNDKTTFITFQHIVAWDNAFVVIMSVMVFIATIRILQILGYNKRMTQLVLVITGAATELLGFAVVFSIIYFAYVMSGYLLFGASTNEYRSIFVTFGSLTNSIIGKNHLDMMMTSDPVFAQIYFLTYIFLVILILISMFAVILNQSISVVKEELQDENVYGLTNVLSDSFKDVVGIFMSLKPQKQTNKQPSSKGKKYQANTRKPDFDPPNIVDLLQEILRQHGGDVPKKPERNLPDTKDSLYFDRPDTRPPTRDGITNTVDDVEISFGDRDMKKVEHFSAFI